jgi:hypothetical protein
MQKKTVYEPGEWANTGLHIEDGEGKKFFDIEQGD